MARRLFVSISLAVYGIGKAVGYSASGVWFRYGFVWLPRIIFWVSVAHHTARMAFRAGFLSRTKWLCHLHFVLGKGKTRHLRFFEPCCLPRGRSS